jgi:high-affinity nickel permease
MTLTWALLLGFGLGVRHASDADHVIAVGTLLRHDASPVPAAALRFSGASVIR